MFVRYGEDFLVSREGINGENPIFLCLFGITSDMFWKGLAQEIKKKERIFS